MGEDEGASISGYGAHIHRIVVEEHELVVSWLRRRLPPTISAEDVAQDAAMTAISAIDGYRGEGTMQAWYWGVVRLCRLRALSRAYIRREVLTDGPPDVPADATDVFEDFERQMARSQEVSELLARLSSTDRDLLTAYHLDDASIQEIANRTSRTAGSVKVMLSRARARAREVVAGITAMLPQVRRRVAELLWANPGSATVLAAAVAAGALNAMPLDASVLTVDGFKTEVESDPFGVVAVEPLPQPGRPSPLVQSARTPAAVPSHATNADRPSGPSSTDAVPGPPVRVTRRDELPDPSDALLMIDAGPAGAVWIGTPGGARGDVVAEATRHCPDHAPMVQCGRQAEPPAPQKGRDPFQPDH